jgi:hypothetical protein
MTVSSNPYQADRRRAKAARMEAVIGAAHKAQPSRFASAADAARDDTIWTAACAMEKHGASDETRALVIEALENRERLEREAGDAFAGIDRDATSRDPLPEPYRPDARTDARDPRLVIGTCPCGRTGVRLMRVHCGPDDPRDGICGECREQRAARNREEEIDIILRMRSGATVTLAESDRMRERL